MEIRPSGRSPEMQFSAWAFAQSLVTTTALMALSIVAIRAVERYGKKALTPLQKQGAGLVATAVYLAASTYIFPWHIPAPSKKGAPNKDDEEKEKTSPPPSIPIRATPEQREEDPAQNLSLVSDPRNPRDCFQMDPRDVLRVIQEVQSLVLQNEVSSIRNIFNWNGRLIEIHFDLSTPPLRQVALNRIDDVLARVRGALPSPQASHPAGEEDFELVLDPARPDGSMRVEPAPYVEGVHGLNGSLMRERLFEALLGQYTRLLEKMDLDPRAKLGSLAQSWYKTSQQQKLQDVLTYLVSQGSEQASWWSYAGYTGFEGRYLLLMAAHRALIEDYTGKEESYDQGALKFGRALSQAWMRPEIQSFQESLVGHFFQGESLPLTPKNVHQALSLRNKAVGEADSRMKMTKKRSLLAKLKGATSFCDYFGVNPPNLRKVETWTKGESAREIYYLRHSTPNQGTWATQAPVDPIYRDFLKGAQEENKGVLYAAHQRLGDFGCKFEQEGYRAQSIVDLEKDHPNLLVLFQSVESNLFMRKIKSTAYLEEQLFESFEKSTEAKRNRLPKCLMKDGKIHPQYKAEMEEIFNFVHDVFFNNKEELSTDPIDCYGGLTDEKKMTWDSQTFIMLFYHFQREHLKHADLSQYGYNCAVTYVNTGCKDDFDRGFGQNMTTDRVHQTIVHGKNIPSEDLEATVSSGQAPPIQTKGVPVIPYRVQPALQVSRILAGLSDDKLRLLQEKTWNGFRLTGYDLRRHSHQSAAPRT